MEILFSLPQADLDEIVQRAENDLRALCSGDVLITGSSGFIGSWITEPLVESRRRWGSDGRLVLLNRTAFSTQQSWVENGLAEVEFKDVRNLSHKIGKFDFVIHAATPTSISPEKDSQVELLDVITSGANAIGSFALREGSRLLNMSSGAVYAKQPLSKPCLSEDDSLIVSDNPTESAYGLGKRLAESILLDWGREVHAQIVNARLFAFLAPLLPLDRHFAAGNFLRDALSGKPILVKGNPLTVRSYQYGTDLAQMLFALLVRGIHGEAYNVGGELPISIRELAQMVSEVGGVQVVSLAAEGEDGLPSPSRYVPCIDKVKTSFGCVNQVSMRDAIQRTFKWHKGQRARNVPGYA